MIAKRRQAELVLEAIGLLRGFESKGGKHYRDRIREVRDRRLETIFWECRLLNARGKFGEEKVRAEMEEAGFVPYSREEFERDMKVAVEELERQKHESHLRCTKSWRERHPDDWRASQKRSQEKRKRKLKEKLESDPEFRQKYYAEQRERNRKYRARLKLTR